VLIRGLDHYSGLIRLQGMVEKLSVRNL